MELFILGHFQAVRLLGEINSVYGAVFEYGHERIKAPLFKVNAAQLALWPAGGPSEKACLGQRRRSLDHRLLRLKEDFFFFFTSAQGAISGSSQGLGREIRFRISTACIVAVYSG
jgi:hypothetical protein